MANVTLMPLHPGQLEVYRGLSKRTVLRIGRRFGNTALHEVIAENAAVLTFE